MHEQLSIKALPWFLKIIAAVIGAILALTLSGDIDTDGRIKINVSVIMKFVFSVAISLYGGSAFIEYYDSAGYYSYMAQGFVMFDPNHLCARHHQFAHQSVTKLKN